MNRPSLDNLAGTRPQETTQVREGRLALPVFYDTVQTLDQTIDVDYCRPGCPSPPDPIQNAVDVILTGNLPEKGAVPAPTKALCDTCHRADFKPDKASLEDVRRPWEIKMDPEACFLAQGLICGPAVERYASAPTVSRVSRSRIRGWRARGESPTHDCVDPGSRGF